MFNKQNSQIIMFMGAVIAYMMGSGFATGQELLQYYVPYGNKAFFVGLILGVTLIFANAAFAYAGKVGRFSKGSQVFNFYCGPVFGHFFDWFTVVFCYMCFIVMVAGAGSTLAQQYSLPLPIGTFAMTIAAILTVGCGLNYLVEIIGRVGPVLAVLVVLIGIATLIVSGQNLETNIERINYDEIMLLKAAPNWFLSGISSGGLSILFMASFMARLGQKYNFLRLMWGQALGIVIYLGIVILITFALIANIDLVAGSQVPNLLLAAHISPVLGEIFGLIIFTAIYTTACPLLWTAASRLSGEGSRRFKIITWLLALSGAIVALFIPFNVLINYIYVLNGYLGIIVLLFIVGKLLGHFISSRIASFFSKSRRKPPAIRQPRGKF